jgi:hypothetical protein
MAPAEPVVKGGPANVENTKIFGVFFQTFSVLLTESNILDFC